MLTRLLLVIGCVIAAEILVILLRYAWLWWTRVRPRKPTLDRKWWSDCAEHASVNMDGDNFTIQNVRDFTWRSSRDHDISWIEKKVNTNEIKDVWFIIDHFHKIRGLAHTMLSFEFNDGQVLTFSFETRREIGDKYHPWDGMWRAFELYLLVATERDALHLRTNVRSHKVHMYRVNAPEGKPKALFEQLCNRINQLLERPEWYHTLSASCSTTIISQVNTITPGRIPKTWRALLPGHAARAAFKYGLIEDWGGYEKTLKISRIDEYARSWNGDGDFSEHIREPLPPTP
ncbi:MAG TPA: DUF4105 domain-containing protein [Candidatus Poseidoniales archaeon]|nr:MAG: hypothetical protein CXT68_07325 [Euryarchaeota archaeon]HIF15894.1 DUF4105 domain-containing protein [Candidatus Poseidoniales archaeon]